MRQYCICRRDIPLAYSFEKHRTVLQAPNSHNSSSFSSKVTGSVEFTTWHLVEVQREDPWNRLDDTLLMGHIHASCSKGRGHQRCCHFRIEWGEDATGHGVSSLETNSLCLSCWTIIIWAAIHKPWTTSEAASQTPSLLSVSATDAAALRWCKH